jgi:hypothetical protein
MNISRRLVLGAVAAVTTAGVAAGTVAATTASAAPAQHVIKFVAVNNGQHSLAKRVEGQTQVDRRNGKIVGYDILHGRFGKNRGFESGAVVLARGLLYFRFPITAKQNTIHGRITGGADAFKGASGTLSATSFGKHGRKAAVVITYQQ